jgi:hypothetical protein
MDSTLVLSAFSDLAGPWKSIIVMVIFSGILAWSLWRMGSPHFLIERISVLFFGKKSSFDSEVDKFVQERSALMQFRLHTGVKARTLGLAHKMLHWCKANGEEMGVIRRCGKYFDIENVELSKKSAIPGQKVRLVFLTLTILFLYCAALLFAMMFVHGVLGSIKNDKASPEFVIRIDRVSTPFRSTGTITRSDCAGDKKAVASTLRISNDQAAMVCSWLADPNLGHFLKRSLNEQRVLLSIPLIFFLWLLVITYPEWASSEAAHFLQIRILGRKQQESDVGDSVMNVEPDRS